MSDDESRQLVEGSRNIETASVVSKNPPPLGADFYYLLACMNLNQYASATTAQPGLSVSLIQNIQSILTPLSEQTAIASCLDEKCAAIDGIIAEKEALITDWETYKKSLIFETVTGKRRVC